MTMTAQSLSSVTTKCSLTKSVSSAGSTLTVSCISRACYLPLSKLSESQTRCDFFERENLPAFIRTGFSPTKPQSGQFGVHRLIGAHNRTWSVAQSSELRTNSRNMCYDRSNRIPCPMSAIGPSPVIYCENANVCFVRIADFSVDLTNVRSWLKLLMTP